jgi:hypothetical protein
MLRRQRIGIASLISFTLTLLSLAAPAGAQIELKDASSLSWNPPSLVTIDPNDPPPDLFTPIELDRLEALNSTNALFFLSKPSPDERTILTEVVIDGEVAIGLGDIPSATFTPIEWPDGFAPDAFAWVTPDRG